MPRPSSASAVKFFQPQPQREVQKMQKISDPSGSTRFETIKSSRSMTVLPAPRGWKRDSKFGPNAQGVARISMRTQLNQQVFLRLQPVRSMNIAAMFSNTPSTVEKAANDMKTKNSDPHSLPHFIWLKIFGRVMKMRDGPASGSTP